MTLAGHMSYKDIISSDLGHCIHSKSSKSSALMLMNSNSNLVDRIVIRIVNRIVIKIVIKIVHYLGGRGLP